MSSNYIEFVANKKTNVYVPLVDVENNQIERVGLDGGVIPNTWPIPHENLISDYYRGFHGAEMPDDRFIRYYYASLAVIGLYVVYRVLLCSPGGGGSRGK